MKTNRFRDFVRYSCFDGEEIIVDADCQSERFPDLTLERGLQRFAGFHLSARKFPHTGMNIIEPL